MARRKTTSGRARASSVSNKIYIQTQKINKMIRSLEKAGNYGTYKSKELIRFASSNPKVSIKKSRGSKRHRVLVSQLREATFGQLALISKKFKEITRSQGFTNVGIEKIRAKTLKTLKDTLRGIKGKRVTRRDVEMFYDIIKYKTDEIISKIGPSEFYALIMDAKDANANEEQWIEMLNNYVNITNDEMRKTAEYLYSKYVR